MECTSDTESETDTVTNRPPSAFHDTNPDSDVAMPCFEAVRGVVESLSERGVPSTVKVSGSFKLCAFLSYSTTFSLQDKSYFQEPSKLLLHFLDRVPQLLSTGHVPEVIRTFSQLGASNPILSKSTLLTNHRLLGTLSFLQRLLDFRKYVRLAEQVPGSKSLTITWIDVVLAKLSILATPIAVGLAAYDLEKEAEWIQLRREDDSVRAATQLPGTYS